MNNNKIIICVDDEPVILVALKEQLKRHFGNQFLYEMTDNSAEALDLIDELTEEGCQIMTIVSDWLMPGMKGDELLIKIHHKYPEISTILLTGQANTKAIENAKTNANLFACIQKPWKESELIDTITKSFSQHNG